MEIISRSNDVMDHDDCVIKRDLYPQKMHPCSKISVVYNFLFLKIFVVYQKKYIIDVIAQAKVKVEIKYVLAIISFARKCFRVVRHRMKFLQEVMGETSQWPVYYHVRSPPNTLDSRNASIFHSSPKFIDRRFL